MSKELVRRNGQLFEEETSLQDASAPLGQTPSTPQGASSLGVSPDVSKMVGSGAQKQAALTQQVEKTDTLAGSKRLDQGRKDATQAEKSASEKADKLKQLGSLGNRVQGLIEQRLKTAAAAPLGQAHIDADNVAASLGLSQEQATAAKTDTNSVYSKVQQELATLAANPAGDAAEVALVNLSKLGIQPQVAKQLISTSSQAAGQKLAATVQDGVKVGELNFQDLGFSGIEEVASLLGKDAASVSALSVPEFQAEIEALRQQQFTRANELRAQLARTPVGSARREMLQRELEDIGQAGVLGTEAKVAELSGKLKTADRVKVGNKEMSAEELLKDENLSQLIVDYMAATPEEREHILPTAQFADLKQWITENEVALGALSSQMTDTVGKHTQTQDAYKNLGNLAKNIKVDDDVLKTFIPGYDPSQPITSAQLEAAKQSLSQSPLGELATDPAFKDVAGQILGKMTVETAQEVKNLSAEEIVGAYNLAQQYNDPAYQDLLGLDGQEDFVLDPEMKAKIEGMKPVIDKLKADGNLEAWTRDENFKALSPEEMLELANNPAQYEEFQEYNKLKDQLDKAENPADILSIIAGTTITERDMVTLQDEYKKAQQYAAMGDKDAQVKLDRLRKLYDLDGDGDIDEADTKALADKVKAGFTDQAQDAIIAGGKTEDLFTAVKDLRGDGDYRDVFHSKDSLMDTLVQFGDDGKITSKELDSLDDDTLQRMLSDKSLAAALSKVEGGNTAVSDILTRRETVEMRAANQEAGKYVTAVLSGPIKGKWQNGKLTIKSLNYDDLDAVYQQLSETLPKDTPALKKARLKILTQVAEQREVLRKRNSTIKSTTGKLGKKIEQLFGQNASALVKKMEGMASAAYKGQEMDGASILKAMKGLYKQKADEIRKKSMKTTPGSRNSGSRTVFDEAAYNEKMKKIDEFYGAMVELARGYPT